MIDIERNVELKDYTTYKIGGFAEFFFVAKTREELISALEYASEKKIKLTMIGGGSNVIISDNGVKGLVLLNRYDDFSIDGKIVTAGSGLALHEFTKRVLANGRGGLEFLANIPGSIGGAVAVNAGCYGKYVDSYLKEAEVFENGDVKKVKPEYFDFEYRNSKIKRGYPAYVISATLNLTDIDLEESKEIINKDRDLRDNRHPKDPSCGSFFKNPSRENTAGGLIEKSGLKGYKIGGAMVSDIHCNFLVNTGNATAMDIKNLSEHVRKTVKEETGYDLEEEVQYLGKF